MQLGLYNKYLKQHRAVFALSLVTLLLVGGTGAYRLVSSNSSRRHGDHGNITACMESHVPAGAAGQSQDSPWLTSSSCIMLQVLVYGGATFQDLWDNNQGYLALWVIQRLSLLLLQCSAAHATAMSFKDPDKAWLSPSAIRLMNSIRRM